MRCFPSPIETETGLTGNRRNNSEGKTSIFQDRPLLDVDFEIADELVAVRGPGRQPEFWFRLRDYGATGLCARQQLPERTFAVRNLEILGAQQAAKRSATKISSLESHPFFVAEGC